MVIPTWEEKQKGTEHIFKAIMAKRILNLGKVDIQIHEIQKTSKQVNSQQGYTKIHYN